MIKKIFSIFVLTIVISLLSVSVFAVEGDKTEIDKSKPINTTSKSATEGDKGDKTEIEKPKLAITITKPNIVGEKVYSNKYTIVGKTTLNNVRIELFKRNSDGSFSEFKGQDEQSAWDVGPSRYFSIDVILSSGYKNSGLNNFRIKAFDKANPEIVCLSSITLIYTDLNNQPKSDIIKDYPLNKFFKSLK